MAQFKQLYSIHKKIIRAITFSPPLTRSDFIFRSLGIPIIYEITVSMNNDVCLDA